MVNQAYCSIHKTKKFLKQSGISFMLRNHVVFLLRSEKTKFFNSLFRSHSSKEFWKLVKLLRGGNHPIPNLTEGDVQAVMDVDKANVFNSFFARCWDYSDDPLPLSP